MSKYISLLTIKGSLCDLNTYINKERSNRYSAAAIKKKMTEKCMIACKSLPKNYYNKVYLTFTWVCKNKKKDPDNIAFAKKFILDALVRTKVLPNDGWNNVSGFKDEFFCEPDNEESVNVIIEEEIKDEKN